MLLTIAFQKLVDRLHSLVLYNTHMIVWINISLKVLNIHTHNIIFTYP